MSERKPVVKEVPCEVCRKEVPADEAKSVEATDYVAYFCGLDCFEKWERESRKTQRSDAGSTRK